MVSPTVVPHGDTATQGAIMSAVPLPKPMRPRSIKVSDELWEAATKAADDNGEHLSTAIRRFLEKYAKDHYRKGGRR